MDEKSFIAGCIFGLINTRTIYLFTDRLLPKSEASGQSTNSGVSKGGALILLGFKFILLGCLVYAIALGDIFEPVALLLGFGLGSVVALSFLVWRSRRADIE